MANHLRMALVETIQTLHQRGWSQRRIAEHLGIHRETVARHLERAAAESKPANAPTGSDDGFEGSKPANAPLGSAAAARIGRPSDCAPWRAVITTMLEQGLTAQRIFQDLSNDHDYRGSYYSVRRFVVKLEERIELPFRRMESGPGEEVQVDFGTGAPLVDSDGKRRRTHVFRMVLSYSRKAYSEVCRGRPRSNSYAAWRTPSGISAGAAAWCSTT